MDNDADKEAAKEQTRPEANGPIAPSSTWDKAEEAAARPRPSDVAGDDVASDKARERSQK